MNNARSASNYKLLFLISEAVNHSIEDCGVKDAVGQMDDAGVVARYFEKHIGVRSLIGRVDIVGFVTNQSGGIVKFFNSFYSLKTVEKPPPVFYVHLGFA